MGDNNTSTTTDQEVAKAMEQQLTEKLRKLLDLEELTEPMQASVKSLSKGKMEDLLQDSELMNKYSDQLKALVPATGSRKRKAPERYTESKREKSSMEPPDLGDLDQSELQGVCRTLGVPVGGDRPELLQRLIKHHEAEWMDEVTVEELRNVCKQYDLPVTGEKTELIARIVKQHDDLDADLRQQ